MTVTCLTTIFFAEAEAVDEEDTERTNCLVTKAILRRLLTEPGGEGTSEHHPLKGPLLVETLRPRRPPVRTSP
jgi:hypothetical protein